MKNYTVRKTGYQKGPNGSDRVEYVTVTAESDDTAIEASKDGWSPPTRHEQGYVEGLYGRHKPSPEELNHDCYWVTDRTITDWHGNHPDSPLGLVEYARQRGLAAWYNVEAMVFFSSLPAARIKEAKSEMWGWANTGECFLKESGAPMTIAEVVQTIDGWAKAIPISA